MEVVHPLRPLVGRQPEVEELSRFLTDGGRPRCLVLSGDPGIGKTTLWQAGLALAREQGWHVLSTRSSPGEAGLLFAALADLVEGMSETALAHVPPPQLHAVEVALRRVTPDPAPVDPFAISLGFLAAVRALADEGRLLIAVDDVQWIDSASADCLTFLARRIDGSPVRFLLSRRGHEPSQVELALEPLGSQSMAVEALSLGATGRLLAEHFNLLPPRRVLRQLHEAAQGNPLFALELGRALHDGGLPDIGADLPLPRHVDEAFALRVRHLPDPVRKTLLAVALSAGLTRGDLEAIIDPLTVQDALDAGLLVLERSHVRPSHPMLGAAARKQSEAAERSALHAAISGVVSDPVLSARHLALSTLRPDAEIAAAVAAAARTAVERGAVHEAEELCAHALRITPPGRPEETDRVLELARCQLNAGDLPGAAALLYERGPGLPPGRPRALARLLLGEATDGVTEERQLDAAMVEAAGERDLYGTALCRKSVLLSCFQVRRLAEAEALAREAIGYTNGTAEEGRARLALAWALVLRGRSVDDLRTDPDSIPPGANLMDSFADRPAAVRRAFRGEPDEAHRILRQLDVLAERRGDPRTRVGLSVQKCEFELRRGAVTRAAAVFGDLELWTALDEMDIVCSRLKALLAALSGRPDEARQWAAVVLDGCRSEHRATWDYLEAQRAIGIAALFENDAATAWKSLGAVWEHCRQEGIDDPGAFPVAGDLVEALVSAGMIDGAGEVADTLRRQSVGQEHPWGLATLKRAQATIESAADKPDRASDALLEAATEYGRLGLEFEQGRTLLAAGLLLRQATRRAAARKAFEEAAAVWEGTGCDGWATKVRSELARISGRRAGAESALTSSEQRVVDLAASGMSNKEIARALVISVYTVEAHLSHAYAKLGVRSRSQLAARVTPS